MFSERIVEMMEIRAIELKNGRKPSAKAMKALTYGYGSPYGKRKAADEGKAETLASQMAAKFAANGLVRAEPSIFGASLSSLVKPASRLNAREAMIAGFKAFGVVKANPTPFGASVAQIVAG